MRQFLLSRLRLAVAPVIAAAIALPQVARPDDGALRVCADPNNLPFSDQQGNGFENKLAELVAKKLGKSLAYTWWPQRRGFVRNTLKAGSCDVIMGVPVGYRQVATTKPYYRSSYVFVSRARRNLGITSLKDPRLHELKIGVHLIGNNGTNSPPAHALGEEGIVANVTGYTIYGDYRETDPPARLIEAVENGEIDLAAAWGPLAGYFAKTSKVPLEISVIQETEDFSPLRFQFDIAMGVRKDDLALRQKLDEIIVNNPAEIRSVLEQYGVPLLPGELAASSH